MNATDILRVNTPQVIHETIDGEVVIVHLETGGYFGLNASGKTLWHLLDGRRSVEEVKAALAKRYDIGPDVLGDHVERFLGTLSENALVAAGPATEDVEHPALADGGGGGSPFEPPELHAYTDMQDLLLLDPIHEVDEAGWPHAQVPADDTGEG